MPTTIESFVKKLESEGVDAGKKAAEKIEAEARKKAEQIVSEAEETARQIVAKAQVEAEKVKTRMNSSLELAARDAVFLLREKLSRLIEIILQQNVGKILGDEETVVSILQEVIPAYTKALSKSGVSTKISISHDLKSRLIETTLGELAHSLRDQNIQMDADYSLAKSGFEYKIEGSTVEVSTASVTSLLVEMIDPELQQFLEKAANAGD